MSTFGCRDCLTCAAPAATKTGRTLAAASLHLLTMGMSWAFVHLFVSHCPQCSHLGSRHQRRADGSFLD